MTKCGTRCPPPRWRQLPSSCCARTGAATLECSTATQLAPQGIASRNPAVASSRTRTPQATVEPVSAVRSPPLRPVRASTSGSPGRRNVCDGRPRHTVARGGVPHHSACVQSQFAATRREVASCPGWRCVAALAAPRRTSARGQLRPSHRTAFRTYGMCGNQSRTPLRRTSTPLGGPCGGGEPQVLSYLQGGGHARRSASNHSRRRMHGGRVVSGDASVQRARRWASPASFFSSPLVWSGGEMYSAAW